MILVSLLQHIKTIVCTDHIPQNKINKNEEFVFKHAFISDIFEAHFLLYYKNVS